MNRFIVIVLDSFGVGAMDDVQKVRPQDVGSNTCLRLINNDTNDKIKWPNLFEMGLSHLVNVDENKYMKSENFVCTSSKLKHIGADSFFGHQEIAGTNPKAPLTHTIQPYIDEIRDELLKNGHHVEVLEKDNLKLLKVNDQIFIGDNMETDLGQAINVVGALDYCGMDMIKEVGKIVRSIVKVSRVIAFGGSEVTVEDIESSIISKDGKYIGIDAPGSGVYKTNYDVLHLGYGIDEKKQVPYKISQRGIRNYFYGKVANIVYNPLGVNYEAVDTNQIFSKLLNDLDKNLEGFYFVNIQETDLAGHAQDVSKYIDIMNISDHWIGEIRNKLDSNDILIIMADHGNDPMVGHSKHTRENVPILIDYVGKKKKLILKERETMADVGQTVAEYFNTQIEYGTSFLLMLK